MNTKTIILEEAVPLFARRGYNAVSMRDLAEAAGIRAPALYNHFKNKEALYLAAVSHAFARQAAALNAVFTSDAEPRERLRLFVQCLCDSMGNDPNFRMLMQRELLDGDEVRLKMLTRDVFATQFKAATRLAEELAPHADPHLLTISIIGLVSKHFDMGPLRRWLPGSRAEHEDPALIAKHIIHLLLHGIDRHDQA